MTTLSTHVLDTASGRPATGMAVSLWSGETLLFQGVADADGRCPALREMVLPAGTYRLDFGVSAYFRAMGTEIAEPPFLDVVPIVFGLGAEGHYHVPLLVAPYGYSTYRGS